jgi:hypothetical protein
MPIQISNLLPMCVLRVMCMNTETYERAVAQLAEEGGTHGEQGTHSRGFGMCHGEVRLNRM